MRLALIGTGTMGERMGRRLLDGARPEERPRDVVVAPGERPAVGLLPETAQDRELLLEHLGAHLDRREREAVVVMLLLVPAGPYADIQATAGHFVHGRRQLGQVARMAERHRRDEDAQADALGLTRQARQHRPGVGRGLPFLAREAVVVVRSEECLEASRFGATGDGELVGIRAPLLGLGHQDVAHRSPRGAVRGRPRAG